MTINTGMKVVAKLHGNTRRMRYAAWRDKALLPEKEIQIIESLFPATPDAPKVTHIPVVREPSIEEPTILNLAANFAEATAKWVAAGFPVVSNEVYRARTAICDSCQFWDGSARLGLGKCSAPGCGCTSVKQWWATENCTEGKWATA